MIAKFFWLSLFVLMSFDTILANQPSPILTYRITNTLGKQVKVKINSTPWDWNSRYYPSYLEIKLHTEEKEEKITMDIIDEDFLNYRYSYYRLLSAGETMSTSIDLSHYFDLTRPGNYSVKVADIKVQPSDLDQNYDRVNSVVLPYQTEFDFRVPEEEFILLPEAPKYSGPTVLGIPEALPDSPNKPIFFEINSDNIPNPPKMIEPYRQYKEFIKSSLPAHIDL